MRLQKNIGLGRLAAVALVFMTSAEAMAQDATLTVRKAAGERIEILLENSTPIAAIQFTLNGTGGVTIESLRAGDRMNTWDLRSNAINDSTVIAVLMRRGNGNLPRGERVIVEADIRTSRTSFGHSVFFSNAVASSPQATALDLALQNLDWTSDAGEAQFVLGQNYPNPFNPSTTIPYTLLRSASVSLTVYDITGRQIATLSEGTQPAGTHAITWNSSDASGTPLPSGIYFVKLQVGDRTEVRKMILTR